MILYIASDEERWRCIGHSGVRESDHRTENGGWNNKGRASDSEEVENEGTGSDHEGRGFVESMEISGHRSCYKGFFCCRGEGTVSLGRRCRHTPVPSASGSSSEDEGRGDCVHNVLN